MKRSMTPMKKMLLITGSILCLLFGFYGAKKLLFIWYMSHYQEPLQTVSSLIVQPTIWHPTLDTIGSLTAMNGVDVSSETPGLVTAIRFQSGQWIKQGEVLVLLDSQQEQANFKSSQAKLKLAMINYQRDLILLKKNAISQSVVDTDLAQQQQAQGDLESIQAQINHKTITAPFSGYLGIRQINLGQYIQAGTPIVTLQSLNPLYVQFELPADNLSQLFINQPIEVHVNSAQTIAGKITAINSKINTETRNVQVQATLPNPKLSLRPGMFVTVTVLLPQNKKVIVLPETAIAYSLHGDSVFLLNPIQSKDKNKDIKTYKVTRQFVKIGEHRDNLVSILEGIKAGDRVVTSGQIKLKNDAKVILSNELH